MRWFADENLVELGNAGMGLPLVVRIAIGHAHFEAIHPFTNGNGRVGRMLVALQMACQKKLPIYHSGFIEEEKQNYYQVLQEAQKKLNYVPIVEFFSTAILACHHESLISTQRIEALPVLWQNRGKFRKGSTAERALTWMITHPIFTVKILQEKFNVSPQAANTATELLVKAKVVRERTGFERNRVFAVEEVISILSRRFGSDPDVALEGAQSLLSKTS
jgi:Fic family protein